MGPLELTDLIGQDVNLAVGTSVWEQTGRDERYAPTDFQRRLVAARAGSAARPAAGVYTYAADGSPARAPRPTRSWPERLVGGPVATDPVARTLAMLVNEAVDLVARGEASAEDVDTAMRLGHALPAGAPRVGRRDRAATSSPRQLAELDAAFPGGRYRPEPGPDRRRAPGPSAAPPTARPTAPTPDLAHVRRMWADDRASAGPRHGAGRRRHRPRAWCG